MTNFEKCRQEMKIEDLGADWDVFCQAVFRVRNEKNCSGRTCTSCYEWLSQEYKPQILDKAEKKYLGNIIRPFRDKVEGIAKLEDAIFKKEYIKILLKCEAGINLPFFDKGSMYKEMETNREYRLKELGI